MKHKSNILTIIRKELYRFFGDRKLVFTTLLMPGLMIYILYSFMGDGLMNQFLPDENYHAKVYVENMPDSLRETISGLGIELNPDQALTDPEQIKQQIADKATDLYIVFPQNFDAQVAAYDTASGNAAPNVSIYYNSTSTESGNIYQVFLAMLDNYESALANKFDVNHSEEPYNLATDEDKTAEIFASMVPMLLMIFVFSGCMAVAPESIAGEKERGTIATLLVTPLKRSELAVGKIISLSIIALLSGVSSFLGTMLSLPKLMGGAMMDGMDASVYQTTDFVMLLLIVLSSVLLIISMIAIVSAFARSVKEASTMVMPLMIVVMFIGITSMFGNGASSNPLIYLIPLYNSVQAMNGIFSFDYSAVSILVTVSANVLYTFGLGFVLTRLFCSEKVMFSK